jgi:N-acyl homoserine lactone hydrolase
MKQSTKDKDMPVHTITPLLLSKLPSEKGPMTYLVYHGQPVVRPYVFWHIRAGDANVLVDTAIEAADYKNYHPGFQRFPFEAVQTFEEALAQVGCAPDAIDIIIQTHLHMDHIYNTLKCRNAKVYVQQEELKFALDPHPIFEILYPRNIIEKIDFSPLWGDATILPGIDVFLAPGHTPGCQAVAVDTRRGKAVITGCCTTMDNFDPPEDIKTKISPFATYPVIAPGIHTDLFQAYDSALRIKRMADIIIPMHDPEAALKKRIP